MTCLCFIRKTKLFLPATCCMKFILFEFEHHLMKQRRNKLNFHCSSCALLLQLFPLQHRHGPITALCVPCNMYPMHTHVWHFFRSTSPQHTLYPLVSADFETYAHINAYKGLQIPDSNDLTSLSKFFQHTLLFLAFCC